MAVLRFLEVLLATTSLCSAATIKLPRSINNGVNLRIMPQGASASRGQTSTDEAGYRPHLRELLNGNGNNVTFVGSVSWGDMSNNLCEAHPGYTIKGVDDVALGDGAYEYLPNVILLNAGTNDCNVAGNDPDTAPERYATLLKNIRTNNPDALVIASSLLPNLKDSVDECVHKLNIGIKEAVDNATADGMKTGWVDVYNAVPKSEIQTSDSTHPTDEGYKLFAEAWFEGIKKAGDQISEPDPNGKEVLETTACGGKSGVKCGQ
ncbi:hypothetical protein CBER1_03790 [Cercospora berteroae]|uniref:SGNH hydrolase-type esterase domain-containing protein n=1 Tax=Cercospora berteroae TaxID=357750 RepID=A0A2S6C872_9PEZI|nr:hypothetical protein CBER1_03790 [Cercospora berteroae]